MFTNASILRIFIGESDKINGKPLYEEIILEAKKRNLLGATVLRGITGFGAHHQIHTSKVLDMSFDLPLVVEIVDQKEKLDLLLPFLAETVKEGLIMQEDTRIFVPGKK